MQTDRKHYAQLLFTVYNILKLAGFKEDMLSED